MPRFEYHHHPVVINQTQPTIYDLPVVDMIPTTIQSSSKDNLKKPLLSNPDMNRTNKHTRYTREYREDSDEPCCDSCCDGVCSDETLCMCLCCCCACD